MNAEQARERMKQAKLIMDEIGPLMDAHDAIPNDTLGVVDELAPDVFYYLRRIAHICEFGVSRDDAQTRGENIAERRCSNMAHKRYSLLGCMECSEASDGADA